MKHVLTSAGLLALGAGSLLAYDPELTRQQNGGPFSLSATVRGFYDDNVNTAPDKVVRDTGIVDPSTGNTIKVSKDPREESFGFQVIPSVHLNLPMDQTFISLGYSYILTWYDKRDPSTDQAHEFTGKLNHEFSPRHKLAVDDSFVVTSEPTVATDNGIITTPLRSRASVFHNRGSIDDTFQLTSRWGGSLGYANSWYDYDDDDAIGGRSALLDRIEHTIRADARYQFNPKLAGIVGYTFGFTTFTADDEIGRFDTTDSLGNVKTTILKSDDRNSYSHYLYVGGDYDITAKLRASVRLGGQYTEYSEIGDSVLSPYADASLTYAFLPTSSLQAGIRHSRSATDVSAVDNKGEPTLDAETTAVYGQIQHQITHSLTVSLLTQYQISTFNDGASDGNTENLWLVGINFGYRFDRHFSAEAGYNYDQLNSDVEDTSGKKIARDYERNRFYVGLKATY
jgi:hypothetical protein